MPLRLPWVVQFVVLIGGGLLFGWVGCYGLGYGLGYWLGYWVVPMIGLWVGLRVGLGGSPADGRGQAI